MSKQATFSKKHEFFIIEINLFVFFWIQKKVIDHSQKKLEVKFCGAAICESTDADARISDWRVIRDAHGIGACN